MCVRARWVCDRAYVCAYAYVCDRLCRQTSARDRKASATIVTRDPPMIRETNAGDTVCDDEDIR